MRIAGGGKRARLDAPRGNETDSQFVRDIISSFDSEWAEDQLRGILMTMAEPPISTAIEMCQKGIREVKAANIMTLVPSFLALKEL